MNWMRTILLCFLICINSTLLLRSDWVVPLEFSVSGSEFRHFGKIIISTTNEATFSETEFDISNQLIESFKVALADNLTYPTYRIRTRDVESSTFPCLFVLSNFAHEISISVDLERQQIFSINMFPYGIYDISGTKEELYCQIDDLLAIQPKLTVKVNLIKQEELPGPHTAAHLQRIEEEKRSRQHGATQDNRSFIAKYWMYIVPVVIFVVVSNAFNIDQGQQE